MRLARRAWSGSRRYFSGTKLPTAALMNARMLRNRAGGTNLEALAECLAKKMNWRLEEASRASTSAATPQHSSAKNKPPCPKNPLDALLFSIGGARHGSGHPSGGRLPTPAHHPMRSRRKASRGRYSTMAAPRVRCCRLEIHLRLTGGGQIFRVIPGRRRQVRRLPDEGSR